MGGGAMCMDHGRLNGAVSPISVTIPNTALLTKEMIKVMRPFHTTLGLANVSFLVFP